MHKNGMQMLSVPISSEQIIKKYDTPSESVRNYYDRSDETKQKRIYKPKIEQIVLCPSKLAWKPNE